MNLPIEKAPCPKCGGSGAVDCVDASALVSLRESAGLSQSELARRMGITRQYINSVERDRLQLSTPRGFQWAQRYLGAIKGKP